MLIFCLSRIEINFMRAGLSYQLPRLMFSDSRSLTHSHELNGCMKEGWVGGQYLVVLKFTTKPINSTEALICGEE